MTNPNFPNIKMDEIFAKVEDLVKPIVESISEAFETPEAETGFVEYTEPSEALIYAIETEIQEIEASESLNPIEKLNAKIQLYKIWSEVAR